MEKEIKFAPLQEETIVLENGIEIIIYSGGTPEDYKLPKGSYFEDEDDFEYEKPIFFGSNHARKIIGKTCQRRSYNNEEECVVIKKVKIKLKNGKEFVGMLSDEAIKNLETTKILPIAVGEDDGFKRYLYTLINLENGLSCDIEDKYITMIHVPFQEKFSEGYFADAETGVINLNTMKPLLDDKGKEIQGWPIFNFHNGICVFLDSDDNDCFHLFAYNKKGELIDEMMTEWTRDDDDDFIEMYKDNEQIIYESGNFFKVDSKGNKNQIQPYTKADEVNPM